MFHSAEFLAYFCTDNLIINHLTQCYTMAQHLLPGRRGYDPHFVSAQSLLWPLLNHQQQVLVAGIFHSLKCHLQNELSVALTAHLKDSRTHCEGYLSSPLSLLIFNHIVEQLKKDIPA